MPEFDDLSGPFDPNLRFEDFSKSFLLKLMHVWQSAWLIHGESWYMAVKERAGPEVANACELAAWKTVGERVNPRYAKMANIRLNTVVDSLKALQLAMDNTTGGWYRTVLDIKSPNHVVETVTRCRTLEVVEREDPDRIIALCEVLEKPMMERYLINPNIRVTPLKLPPRKNQDDIACQWEFKVDEQEIDADLGAVDMSALVMPEGSKVPELSDYSGPYKPDLKFEDFSKDFLLKLINIWQYAWLTLEGAWYDAANESLGFEAANDCNLKAWLMVGERVNPRLAKAANIDLNNVVDSLKALQLPLDNTSGGLFVSEYDIRTANHVILTVTRCLSLEYFERKAPHRIIPMCHEMEGPIIQKYCVNPKVKVTPLKLPPRKSPDEIACQWELTLKE